MFRVSCGGLCLVSSSLEDWSRLLEDTLQLLYCGVCLQTVCKSSCTLSLHLVIRQVEKSQRAVVLQHASKRFCLEELSQHLGVTTVHAYSTVVVVLSLVEHLRVLEVGAVQLRELPLGAGLASMVLV